MRRLLALALCGVVLAVTLAATSRSAAAQRRQRVALPEGTVLAVDSKPVVTRDGSIGLVAPAVGDTLDAFAVQTGDVVGRLEGLGNATSLALHEDGPRRLAVLTFTGGSNGSAVVVVDASDPAAMSATAIFRLADGLELAPNARAELARGQKYGVVAIAKPVAALISFDVETGEQVGALTLDGDPERMTLVDRVSGSIVAVASASASKVALVSLSEAGVLLPLSTFVAPEDAPLSSANNVAFDAAGAVGYVASLRGHALLSFTVETGELVDRLETQGSSAGVTVYHAADRELIAVTNVSRPGSTAEDDVAPKSDDTPLGLPGAVVATSDASGKLAERSRFYPDTGEELAPANNAEFSADGATIYVPARTGSLYAVDVETGVSIAREGLENRIQSIAAAPLAESVAVLSAGGSEGHIELVPAPRADVDISKPESSAPADTTGETAKRERDKADATPPSIERLGPAVVQSGRRRDLPVTVVGNGFAEGAVVVIGSTLYSAAVGPNGKRANFTLSSSLFGEPGLVPVQVRNPDGSVSNVVNLEVVTPFAPIITRVRPKKILSGNDGVDVTVVGDHFRDGALAKVTYTDRDGTTKTEELKSYRLSFTTLVARMPSRLVRRAAAYQLTVTDRDGVTVSQAEPLVVAGPAVSSITPERLIAGEVGGEDALVLHVSGENFHQDAAVFVRRPLRNPDDGAAPLVPVPQGNVNWKSGERLVVRLSGSDVSYAGVLVVRVVNPVSGEKRKNGDGAEGTVMIAGPTIVSTAPSVVIAGSDAFFLKITGTDFRRSAIVKLTRDGGGQGQRRAVVVDDPNVKDRKQINVDVSTPELLRLVARPGTIHVRVVNSNGADGAPSPSLVLQIVAPGITGTPELIPSVENPSVYRLKVAGQYFREGAVVQIYDASGAPVGTPLETHFKSSEELVAIIGRGRVNDLRSFKVVVVNPGGPYNGSGVPSNPVDVTAN